ncbi:MAG: YfhO family protein [Bacteroides sp.]|nr:YfhO family protein [Bacteroides sp.]
MKKFAKKLKNIYVLSFLIPVLGVLGIFIGRGIFPFGKNSFMFSDMYHQYIPFLKEFVRKLHEGESLIFSWYVGLGSNFVPVYAYYLASPLNWLAYFCPESYLIEFMTYFVVLKIGLCGVTFAYYLRKRFGTKDLRIVWFSVFYALSGFMAAYNWNHMWMDVIWLAPLVILGLEELVKKGKYRLYCLTLCASIFSNYYLSILLCIFLVLYFFLQLFTNGLSFKQKGRAVLQFGLFSMLAGGMAAVLLFPVIDAMQISDFQGGSFPKKVEVYFNVLEMIARHVPMMQAERGLEHWPNIYCGVLAFILVPVYFCHKKIAIKQKIGHFLLLAIMLAAFSINILNYIWHGLNYPNSLPARQSFLYIFVVLTLCFEAVYRNGENGLKNKVAGVIIGCLMLVACGIFVTTDGLTVSVMASAWIFLAGYIILTLLFSRSLRKRFKKRQALGKLALCGKWLILVLVSVEAIMNMEHTSLKPVQRPYYMNHWEDYEVLADRIAEEDPGIYRLDSLAQMTKNDGVLANYMSASAFSSGLNGAVEDYYDILGMGGTKVSYYYQGATQLTAALLGVKYTFSQELLREEDMYEFVARHGTTYLYKNRYALPMGFVLSEGVKQEVESNINGSTTNNAIIVQNSITADICHGKGLFRIESGAQTEGNTITVSVTEDGHLYGLVIETPEGKVLLHHGEEEKELKKVSTEYLLDLGWFAEGETFTITATEAENINIRIYRLQEDVLAETVETLGEQPFVAETMTDTGMTGRVNAKEEGILVLSIPNEPGWTVYVDGMETETDKFANTMLAIPVTAGEHEISLEYHIYGVKEGAVVSLICLGVYLLAEMISHRRKPKTLHSQDASFVI